MAKSRGMTVVDRVGQRYGRLVVTSRSENRTEPSGAVRAFWNCVCECGVEKTVSGQALSRGRTLSCGCLASDARKQQATHDMSGSGTYKTWHMMVQRCTNPNGTHWDSYGGRGITICDEWKVFENFHRDMGTRPENTTLDRIDNEKGYGPDNCRWASKLEQANNRRTNIPITLGTETKTIAEWGRSTGLGKSVVANRLRRGWPVWKALTEPLQDTGKRRRKLKLP